MVDLKAASYERAERALELRESGMTYREVGQSLSPPVGPNQARQLAKKAANIRASGGHRHDEYDNLLPAAVVNCLRGAGINPGQLKALIESGRIREAGSSITYDGCKIHGIGQKSFKKICQMIGR